MAYGCVPTNPHPKPRGGDRPIGITPLLAAIFLEIHGETITDWDEGRMNFWEDALLFLDFDSPIRLALGILQLGIGISQSSLGNQIPP